MLEYVEKKHGGNFHRKLFEILLFYAAQKKNLCLLDLSILATWTYLHSVLKFSLTLLT